MKSSQSFLGESPYCPRRSSVQSRQGAFTLPEMLVAIAVMTMMLAIFSQMIGATSQIWSQIKGGVDNSTQARAVLDTLQIDLSRAVIRPDLGVFCNSGGSTVLAFYTEGTSLDASATSRQLQLVSYALQPTTSSTTMTLQRSVLQIAWTDTVSLSFGTSNALPQLASSSMDSENAAQGILALAITFRNSDGSLTSTFSPGKSQAITVSLAAVADKTSRRLTSAQKTILETAFTTAAGNAQSQQSTVESLWNQLLNNNATFWQTYPFGSAGDIRIFSRSYGLSAEE